MTAVLDTTVLISGAISTGVLPHGVRRWVEG